MSKTKVIFRKFPDGDIIALFPEEIASPNYYSECLSYQHIGQHGKASVDLVQSTEPASLTESQDLIKELQSIGYDLQIIKRFRQGHFYARQKEYESIK